MPKDQDKFPESLEYTDPGERLPQALGWQFGTWGGYLLVAGCWVLGQKDFPFWWAPLIAFPLGAGLIYWEMSRRKNRTTVCVRGSRLGIYRKGKFDMEVGRGQSATLFKAPGDFMNKLYAGADALTRLYNTFIYTLAPLCGVAIGAAGLFPTLHQPFLDLAAETALCVASTLSIVSIIWLRHFHKAFLLPRKTGSGGDFRIPRAQAARLIGGSA